MRLVCALTAVAALGTGWTATAEGDEADRYAGVRQVRAQGDGKCSNVLQVKEGNKVVNYFLDDKGNAESYHEGVCGGERVEGVTVTGTVSDTDGKKYIKPTKVETKK